MTWKWFSPSFQFHQRLDIANDSAVRCYLKCVAKVVEGSNEQLSSDCACGIVTPWTVSPRKRSPLTIHGRIIGSPQTKYHSNTCSLPVVDGPPAAIFSIASAVAMAIEKRTAWTLPFNQNTRRQHLVKSLQEGEMTPLDRVKS